MKTEAESVKGEYEMSKQRSKEEEDSLVVELVPPQQSVLNSSIDENMRASTVSNPQGKKPPKEKKNVKFRD